MIFISNYLNLESQKLRKEEDEDRTCMFPSKTTVSNKFPENDFDMDLFPLEKVNNRTSFFSLFFLVFFFFFLRIIIIE